MAHYPGADGLKTGFIQASGFNLAASAVRNNHRLIAVVMGGNTARWRDQRTADLLDRGFEDVAVAANRPARSDDTTSRLAGLNGKDRTATFGPANLGEGDADAGSPEVPTPRRRASTVTAKSDNWGVQVGAYSDRKAAEVAARVAMAAQTDAVASHARSRIDPLKASQKTLYRARVVDLSFSDAQRTCGLMKREAKPCMVIKP